MHRLFLLEFGEKLKRLKTQKSAEWVCVGVRVVSYLFSQNWSGPLIARKDVGGGFLVLPLSASCSGLWCGGVCAVPLVTRAAGVHWSLAWSLVRRASTGLVAQWASCCSAGRSCGRHPAVSLLVSCVVCRVSCVVCHVSLREGCMLCRWLRECLLSCWFNVVR